MLVTWPNHPENPLVHQGISNAHETQGFIEDAKKTRAKFVDLYGPGTDGGTKMPKIPRHRIRHFLCWIDDAIVGH